MKSRPEREGEPQSAAGLRICDETDRGRDCGSVRDLSEGQLHAGGLDLRAESGGRQRPGEVTPHGSPAGAIEGSPHGSERAAHQARRRLLECQRREMLAEERVRLSGGNSERLPEPAYTEILRRDAEETQGSSSETPRSLPETHGVAWETAQPPDRWTVSAEAECGRSVRWELPLERYVQWAIQQNAVWLEKRADLEPVEGDRRGWAGPTFLFAAHMRSYSALARADARGAAMAVERVLEGLYPGSPHPWLSAFRDTDTVGNLLDPYDDFLASWEKVKHPLVEGDFIRAVRLADEFPLFCSQYQASRHTHYVLLVSVCLWLGRLSAPEPFFISVRKAGELVGKSHVAGSQLLKRMMQEGLISSVQEATRSEARSFVFNEDRVRVRPCGLQSDDRASVPDSARGSGSA